MLNGGTDNMIPLEVQGHSMYLLAMDGVNFPAPRERAYNPNAVDGEEQVLLAPGGRAEFLIKGSTTPGVYSIMQLAQKQQFLESQAKVLAEIEISGDAMDMALPKSLPLPTRHYPLLKADEVKNRRDISFDMTFPPTQNLVVGLDFAVDEPRCMTDGHAGGGEARHGGGVDHPRQRPPHGRLERGALPSTCTPTHSR